MIDLCQVAGMYQDERGRPLEPPLYVRTVQPLTEQEKKKDFRTGKTRKHENKNENKTMIEVTDTITLTLINPHPNAKSELQTYLKR